MSLKIYIENIFKEQNHQIDDIEKKIEVVCKNLEEKFTPREIAACRAVFRELLKIQETYKFLISFHYKQLGEFVNKFPTSYNQKVYNDIVNGEHYIIPLDRQIKLNPNLLVSFFEDLYNFTNDYIKNQEQIYFILNYLYLNFCNNIYHKYMDVYITAFEKGIVFTGQSIDEHEYIEQYERFLTEHPHYRSLYNVGSFLDAFTYQIMENLYCFLLDFKEVRYIESANGSTHINRVLELTNLKTMYHMELINKRMFFYAKEKRTNSTSAI